ncbi:MAG: IS630 family transposase, partial [Methylobacter sp.]
IPDQNTLKREIKAWQDERNKKGIRVSWRFTTQDARVKLKSLYSAI